MSNIFLIVVDTYTTAVASSPSLEGSQKVAAYSAGKIIRDVYSSILQS